jgi:hypothetical protein
MSGIRAVIATALITAITATGLTMYAYPRFVKQDAQGQQQTDPLQPAVYNGPQGYTAYQPAHRQRALVRRAAYSQPYEQPAYSSRPPVRRTRSTRNSVLIVAGSAGTGAAIGALAGGGKGAGIGALAGGAAGFIYDRLTHNR